jgi:anionic cell wall polymer biosynthesis LytR-Cps2A-Psr (LCP) family protein
VAAAIAEGVRHARRRRGRVRATGAALAVAAVVSVPSTTVAVSTDLLGVPAAPARPATSLNVLLLGTDARHPGDRARTDTIVVVHIPASRDRAYLVTVPRDTPAAIPGHGTEKVNSAYLLGGASLAESTVSTLVGVPFDAAATVTFDGLSQLVQAAGGVNLCVDRRTTSIHIGHTADGRLAAPYRTSGTGMQRVPGVTPEVYDVGCRRFAGWQAVDYVRQRMLVDGARDGMAERDKHARDLLQALLDQVGTNPARLSAVLVASRTAVALRSGDLSLTDWLGVLRGVRDLHGIEYVPRYAPDLRQALATDTLDAYLAAHPS